MTQRIIITGYYYYY